MEKEADDYCEKIFTVIMMHEHMGKRDIRFNELYRKLAKYGAKMSKPTLVEHLNHLVKDKVVQRERKDKQNVSYSVDWKSFRQFEKIMQINEEFMDRITKAKEFDRRNEETFKSKSLAQQTYFTTAIITIGELYYLKLMILNNLEPENKLVNYYSYTLIRQLYNIYAKWLLDACKESQEDCKRVLHAIDTMIKAFKESGFFDKNPDAEPVKPEDKIGILKEF